VLNVDIDRLIAELDRLAHMSDAEAPAVTRVLYTQPDMRARAMLKEMCTAAGLQVREDAVGNLFARWLGREPNLPAVGTGSHTDAIPYSGRYDGTVGVLGGLEAIRTLQAAGFSPKRSIELLMFTSEEPTRFGIGCVGCRLMSGAIEPAACAELRDSAGARFDDVRLAAGFTGTLASARLGSDYYSAFVELHIEQGPILEDKNLAIGAVTAIAAPAALRVKLTGSGGHAGAVLMPIRRDALCAAAEIVLAVEAAAKESGSPDTVGTVGICDVHPGAINSVPSEVNLTIDIRDVAPGPRDGAVERTRQVIDTVCAKRGVAAEIETIHSDPPAAMAEHVVRAVEQAAVAAGASCIRMVSRAYHDSLFMARIAPTGMIFIPCYKGYSHRPDEYSSPGAIKTGVEVLARTLRELSEA